MDLSISYEKKFVVNIFDVTKLWKILRILIKEKIYLIYTTNVGFRFNFGQRRSLIVSV